VYKHDFLCLNTLLPQIVQKSYFVVQFRPH